MLLIKNFSNEVILNYHFIIEIEVFDMKMRITYGCVVKCVIMELIRIIIVI